jgi:hypothetical protein
MHSMAVLDNKGAKRGRRPYPTTPERRRAGFGSIDDPSIRPRRPGAPDVLYTTEQHDS